METIAQSIDDKLDALEKKSRSVRQSISFTQMKLSCEIKSCSISSSPKIRIARSMMVSRMLPK